MVTKGIVEQIIDDYSVRVRIPFFNGIANIPNSTPTEELYIATIATLPNCKLNLQLGDIVYLAFEDNSQENPVVVGQLSRVATTERNPILKADTLTVAVDSYLPAYTYIGDITPNEIKCLQGASDNLQYQIKILSEQVAKLEEELNKLKG